MKIDSHQHFWKYSVEEYDWIDDSMSVLREDFLPAQLEPLLRENGLEKSIAVQARCTNEETEWLLELAEGDSCVAGVVGWLDLKSDELEGLLEKYKANSKFVGLREVLQGHEPEFMLEPQFIQGVKLLAKYDLAYDILVFPRHLKAVKEFIAQLDADQRLVIDHLAKPLIGEALIDEWAEDMHEIAKNQNVYCKLSGMVTEAGKSWKDEDFTAYMEVLFDAFGEDRIMYGSDWPVCLLEADYQKVHSLAHDYVAQRGAAVTAKVFGLNAAKFYRI